MKNATIKQLRALVTVAEKRSFVRASESLHVTAPAVTMQVRDLEAEVGLPLFNREGREVTLTSAGEYCVLYAKRVLATLKEADDMMARLQRTEAGRLSVGLVSTAKYFLPRLLARFHEQHPGIEIKLRVYANRDELLDLLRDAEIDLAVMGRPPKAVETQAFAFAAHPHVFVSSPDHEMAQQDFVPARALDRVPFIFREPGSGTRQHMTDFFEQHQVHPELAMEMPSNESIKQAVMAGMGLSFLSLHTIGLEVRNRLITVLPVEDTPIMRTWNVVRLTGKVQSPAADALQAFILESGEAQLAALNDEMMGGEQAARLAVGQ
jgi:DNA-binding transcriptional LysR family regulator